MLDKLFPFIIENYRVLEIEGHRIFTYENNVFEIIVFFLIELLFKEGVMLE